MLATATIVLKFIFYINGEYVPCHKDCFYSLIKKYAFKNIIIRRQGTIDLTRKNIMKTIIEENGKNFAFEDAIRANKSHNYILPQIF